MSTNGKLLLLLLLILPLYAEVTARVDENPIIASEQVDYEIAATGDRVQFPKIESIGGARVTTEGSRRLEWFDGNKSVVKWVQVYSFTPKKSVTIPAFKIMVDGKEKFTKPIFLQVKPNLPVRKENFKIELDVSRKEAYVGQTVDVIIRFKERRNIPVMSVDFVPLKYENFWVKRIAKQKRYSEGDYLVHEVRYLFFPQKAGDLTIGPAEVKVAMAKKIRDAFGFIVRQPQWISLVSKPMKLHVKPLPDDLRLVGKYTISANASPKKVEAGSPVTLVVRVEAIGNIEDFELPPLHIPGVTVYSEAPKIKNRYTSGIYSGTWERRYVLIAERPFTIPPFKVRFFDPKKKEAVTVSSKAVKIEVTGGAKEPEESLPSVKRSMKKSIQGFNSYLLLTLAFAAGMGVMYLLLRLKEKIGRKKRPHLQSGSEPEMLQRLLPYISESKEAAQMAENLYANLFEGRAVKIDKKAYNALMERLEEKR